MSLSTQVPAEMDVASATAAGGPEVLVLSRAPVPAPKCGEILVRVAAAGVNRPDILQRQGDYPPPPGVTPILGLEVAGTVAALGPGVDSWKIGDAVCGLVIGGGYAQYCIADARFCMPVPKGFSMVMAGGLPETFFTVWTNVFDRGKLVSGERFLVHGGASGIGTTAIQLARAFGARVFATAGTAVKCRKCEELGAEKAFNYRDDDFVSGIKTATGGKGVNLVLDVFGGEYFARNVDVLAEDGRLVQIAFRTGIEAERRKVPVDFMPMIRKRLTITGSTLRPQSANAKAAIAASLRERVWPMLEAGKIRPVIDATYPLARASEAHARMESGEHIGKIVLTV